MKALAWISDGCFVSRDLPPTQQIALLYYTSQGDISLFYCEKHITIISYVVPPEVHFKEEKRKKKKNAREPFSGLIMLCFPIIPTQSYNTQVYTRAQMIACFSVHLELLNTDLAALSSEQNCLGCFR